MRARLQDRKCTCLWGNSTVTDDGKVRVEVTFYDPLCPYPPHRLA